MNLVNLPQLSRAARHLRRGGLVVFPTETVYGLGADATNVAAVARVFAAKGRPADNPLIVHLSSVAGLATVAASSPAAERLFRAFAPGPFTLVLPAREEISRMVTGGLPTVALRVPSHPVARHLLRRCGVPVAAPSANRSGEPSPTRVTMARRSLSPDGQNPHRIIYLDGGPSPVGIESTVASLRDNEVTILRAGGVTREMIQQRFPSLQVRMASLGETGSPGTRHRHYQPRARVMVIERTDDVSELHAGLNAEYGLIGLEDDLRRATQMLHPLETRHASELRHYASNLYRWFSELDALGISVIVAVLPENAGLGAAIRDRLERAAGGLTGDV